MINIFILIFNIVGTLFLSVEAIKLENFQKLSHLLKKYNSIVNQKIVYVDEFGNRIEEKAIEAENEEQNLNGMSFLKMILGFYPLSLVILYLSLNEWIYNYGIVLLSILGSFVVWTITLIIFEGFILFFKFLEKKLAKGIVGITGFVILFVSFCLQYYVAIK